MDIAVVLGAAKEPMQLRLEEALKEDYEQVIITGTEEEMHFLDDKLENVNVARYQAFSTFGNYVVVYNNTNPEDKLTFYGHESHTQRMKVYQEHFDDRVIENVVLPDPNLKPVYKAFDRFSATVHRLALRFVPEIMEEQARDKDSVLNRYIIPAKNRLVN